MTKSAIETAKIIYNQVGNCNEPIQISCKRDNYPAYRNSCDKSWEGNDLIKQKWFENFLKEHTQYNNKNIPMSEEEFIRDFNYMMEDSFHKVIDKKIINRAKELGYIEKSIIEKKLDEVEALYTKEIKHFSTGKVKEILNILYDTIILMKEERNKNV